MMRLGRLPHVPEAVAAAPKLGARMPPPAPPPRLDRSKFPYSPQLLGNDANPTCTCVAQINAGLGFAACDGWQFIASTDQVNLAYSAVTGTPLDQIAASDGAVLLDVMRYQARIGIKPTETSQILLTGAFGVIDPSARALIATACADLGPVILGVDLTTAEQMGGVWDQSSSEDVGGHAVALWDYSGLGDTDTVRIATWGELQLVTWRWLASQLREAYGVVWPGLLGPSGRSFAGLDIDGLRADVAAWCGT